MPSSPNTPVPDAAPKDKPSPGKGQPVSDTAAAGEDPPTIPSAPKPRTRLALVGLGKLMIEEILPALRLSERCQISALVTGDLDKGKAIARSIGLAHDRVLEYSDLHELKSDDMVDAVYIATPNSLHARDAIASFKAGKHVLCEKPLASTIQDAQAMIDAAARADRQLMTAYRVHHEPINKQIKAWIKEQKFGKPRFITFDTVRDVGEDNQYRLDAALAGGGSLVDIGIYALNTSRWLLGEEPVEVVATQWNDPSDERFKEVEASIAFQLLFPSGCIASCTSSYGTARVNRYRVICEQGWLGMDPATSYRGLQGEYGDDASHVLMQKPESVNQFTAQFDHFARCIQEGKPNISPGQEGLRDMQLIQAIYESAKKGAKVRV